MEEAEERLEVVRASEAPSSLLALVLDRADVGVVAVEPPPLGTTPPGGFAFGGTSCT